MDINMIIDNKVNEVKNLLSQRAKAKAKAKRVIK